MGDANRNADGNFEGQSPLTLERLREAFATMLRPHTAESQVSGRRVSPKLGGGSLGETALRGDPCETSPRSVVEAMLFVGRPDNRPLSAREMAATMRGVSPSEIDQAVSDLNEIYAEYRAPYRIMGTANGYHMALDERFSRVRDKFQGRVREAKLSPAALEVLSVVAYNQPVTAEAIHSLRGAASGAVLSTLVRRQLVRLQRGADRGQPAVYTTTERFLRLFGLPNLAALPRSEELEAA